MSAENAGILTTLFHHSHMAAIVEVRSIPIPDLNSLDDSRTESSTLLVHGIALLSEDDDSPLVAEVVPEP